MKCEFSSSFNDVFSKITVAAPTQANCQILKAALLDTKLGAMIVIANEKHLYLLEFADSSDLEREVEFLRKKLNAAIISGRTTIINSIESELSHYLEGKLQAFKTPTYLLGTPFQNRVWEELKKIPFGQTRSYLEIAKALNKPTGFRAVAQANGANRLSIIIPCHRVINANGELGGYGGGIVRKQWLLENEKKCH